MVFLIELQVTGSSKADKKTVKTVRESIDIQQIREIHELPDGNNTMIAFSNGHTRIYDNSYDEVKVKISEVLTSFVGIPVKVIGEKGA